VGAPCGGRRSVALHFGALVHIGLTGSAQTIENTLNLDVANAVQGEGVKPFEKGASR
jgi:hypothetical protein